MSSFTQHINKVALLLLLLYAISIGINMASNLIFDFIAPGYAAKEIMTIQIKIYSLLFYLFKITINIGCAIWLFFESKKEQNNIWLWTSIGLFAGVFGIIVWFLKEILHEIKQKNVA